jgi:hypothetical protein
MCQLRLDKLFMSCIAMSVLSAACMFVSALCIYVLGRASDRFMPCTCCLLTQLVCYRWLG